MIFSLPKSHLALFSFGRMALFITLIWVNASHAASFDCESDLTPVEAKICNDFEISHLDDLLGQSYKNALVNSSDPQSLKVQQRAWLKDIRNKCYDSECLKQVYKERISVLSTIGTESPQITGNCVYNEYGRYCNPLIPNYNGTGMAYLPPAIAEQYFLNLQREIAAHTQRQIDFYQGYQKGISETKGQHIDITINQTYQIKGPTDIRNIEYK